MTKSNIVQNVSCFVAGKKLKNAKKQKANFDAAIKEIKVELLQGNGAERYFDSLWKSASETQELQPVMSYLPLCDKQCNFEETREI